jgi:hypothetical protein
VGGETPVEPLVGLPTSEKYSNLFSGRLDGHCVSVCVCVCVGGGCYCWEDTITALLKGHSVLFLQG